MFPPIMGASDEGVSRSHFSQFLQVYLKTELPLNRYAAEPLNRQTGVTPRPFADKPVNRCHDTP